MNKIIFCFSICLTVISCTKRDEVGVPDFNVTTSASAYKVGDTITFNFTGNPHNIVFWSGMPGHVYEYRDRVLTTGNKLLVKFNTYQQFGVRNNLTVLVSNNFNGTYDTTNVKKATWTDITGRVTLSAGADQVPSGTIDLSETNPPRLLSGTSLPALSVKTGGLSAPLMPITRLLMVLVLPWPICLPPVGKQSVFKTRQRCGPLPAPSY